MITQHKVSYMEKEEAWVRDGMVVYRNTTPRTLYFRRDDTERINIMHNLQYPGRHIPRAPDLWPPLHPGEYIALDRYPRGLMSLVEEILKKYQCPGEHFPAISTDWAHWAYIEMAKLNAIRIYSSAITREHDRIALEIMQYIEEKLPHKDAVMVYARDVLGAVWLQNVSDKLWLGVLQPALRRYAEKYNFGLTFSKRGDRMVGPVDLKIYCVWNEKYDVRMEPWDSLNRLVKEYDRYYAHDPLQCMGGARTTKG